MRGKTKTNKNEPKTSAVELKNGGSKRVDEPDDESEIEYEVEKIVAMRVIARGQKQYLLKWKGYPE